jgi:hypothetical protein
MIFHKESIDLGELPSDIIVPIDIKAQTGDNIITSNRTPAELDAEATAICTGLKNYIAMNAKVRAECITLLVEEQEISQILQNPARIEVASDGGFDPATGISSYCWVIALNRVLVAKGRGPAEAHPDLGESFRSEGYGIASASAFLMAMVTFLNISVDDHIWKFYIDNKAMIQRLESYRHCTPHSRWHLRSDADITNKANENLQHIPAIIEHVKSHQDELKQDRFLTFDAHLNIMADAMATQQRELMTKPVTQVQGDRCLLVIKDRYITRDSQRWLMQKAGEIPIQHYYRKKYGWSWAVFNSIHWEMQQKTLTNYKQNDQRRILKFVHDWLPTTTLPRGT